MTESLSTFGCAVKTGWCLYEKQRPLVLSQFSQLSYKLFNMPSDVKCGLWLLQCIAKAVSISLHP